MHIAVFVQRILDPELTASRFRIDPEAGDARVPDAPYVMGPYDENALETALKVKDQDASVRVTAVSYGPPEAEEILRKALSTGADDAVLVLDEGGRHDAFQVASVLAAAARRLGPPDLLLFGLQSGDWDSGQTAFAAAELLDAAAVSYASAVEPLAEGGVRVHRVLEDASEEVFLPRPPVVLSVTNDGRNALRMAKVKDILMAKRKPVERLTVADLGGAAAPRVHVAAVAAPEVRRAECTFIEGEDGAAKGRALAERLLAEHLV
ncbi:MAG: electron transfer flavoprotein subunit beta/FixA family protein [Firmicutes bacterium]|nr:electron transfer flavoprotein subunit beta/FixA family protein [Bacillota bacterium]